MAHRPKAYILRLLTYHIPWKRRYEKYISVMLTLSFATAVDATKHASTTRFTAIAAEPTAAERRRDQI